MSDPIHDLQEASVGQLVCELMDRCDGAVVLLQGIPGKKATDTYVYLSATDRGSLRAMLWAGEKVIKEQLEER